VIEDLDGGDPGPGRAAFVRAISVGLAFASLLGYAALSSTALRGPYATPDPARAAAAIARHTPEPAAGILGDFAISVTPATAMDCYQVQRVYTTNVFAAGHPVTIVRVVGSPPPGVETIPVVTLTGPSLMWRTCAPDAPTPIWWIAP